MKKRYALIFVLILSMLLVSAAAAGADDSGETYTVRYYKNSCLAEVPVDETEYAEGDEVTVLFEPIEYRDNKTFYGWSTSPTGTAEYGYDYDNFVMPASDVKLYAICTAGTVNYAPAPQPRRHSGPGPCRGPHCDEPPTYFEPIRSDREWFPVYP